MNFKIDTKDQMHVITLNETILTVNMADDLKNLLLPYIEMPVKNVVINLKQVEEMDEGFATTLSEIQHTFYNGGNSMVICELNKQIQKFLDEKEFLDEMNITPTESEAWDMVQMEEIERELLG